MKVWDRYLGQQVDLPERVLPGRYRLLKATCLNGDISLKTDDVVFADGREACHFDVVARYFQLPEKENTADLDLLSPAMTTLGQLIRDGGEKGLSPLLPAKVGDLSELTKLEKNLHEHIHHLQEINLRPRMNMHYEVEVSPLSRARRIAPAAVTRLASHSEDWHRRTFSGIQPKNILALFSEDEWAIYENLVFARLLDKLDKQLSKREGAVRKLEEIYSKAHLIFGTSEMLHHRLRTSLCALWGESLNRGQADHKQDGDHTSDHASSESKTNEKLKRAKGTIEIICALSKMVKILRQSDLYRHIPRNAHVPEQLRDTNILQHDPHYRHLRTLWLQEQEEEAKAAGSPAELYERNRLLFDNYVLYIGMLIRRALSDHKLIKTLEFLPREGVHVGARYGFAGSTATLTRKHDGWVLGYEGGKLTIVPALNPPTEFKVYGTTNNPRIPVFLFRTTSNSYSTPNDPIEDLIINPLEFYGLERIRIIVNSFLWRPVFASYAKPLRKLPAKVEACLLDQGGTKAASQGGVILPTPLRLEQKNTVEEMLRSSHGINDETKGGITRQITNLNAIETCHCCGKTGQFTPRDNGFIAHCLSCKTEWSLSVQDGRRTGRFTISGDAPATFETHGAWHFEFII